MLEKSIAWIVGKALMPAGDFALHQGMMRRLAFLREAQWWDRERIEAYRDQRLRELLKICYHQVPFYRSLWNRWGIRWQHIDCAERLGELPIIGKEDLRPQYPHATTRRTRHKTYEASSSGSTGKNFFVTEDAETAGQYRAAFVLALHWAGWRMGEAHVQTGINTHRDFSRRLKDRLLRCHYAPAFDLTDTHLDSVLDVLERKRIAHLWGYPGSLYFLARRALARGWNRPLKTLVTWGDNLFPHYRTTIEQAFGVRVFDTYGCGEGFQIAAQCGSGQNYHLHDLDVIAEFVDDSGRRVGAGQPGNVIITRLHPGPMPLVRYRVGDLGVQGRIKSCPCGRQWQVLSSIEGRDTDVVLTPSGNRLIVHFFTGILPYFTEIDCFQVLQEEIGSVVLRVVEASPGSINKTLESKIIEDLRRHGMEDMNIYIEKVPAIPLTASGKRRFVISKIARPDPCVSSVERSS